APATADRGEGSESGRAATSSGRRAEQRQTSVDGEEDRLPRPAGGEMEPPPPHRAHDAGAELEEPQAQRAERGRGERRVGQDAEPEEMQQVVGERVQQEAAGVRAEGVAGEAIGREVALELLDEVLGLAPLVIPGEDVGGPATAVGDDEAYVRALRGVLN